VLTYIVALGPKLIERPTALFFYIPACFMFGWFFLPANLLHNFLGFAGESVPAWLHYSILAGYWIPVLSMHVLFVWKRRWCVFAILGIILLASAKGCVTFADQGFD